MLQSRTALTVWRGLDTLERQGISPLKLEAYKENLEVALRDDDDVMLGLVEKEVKGECEGLGVGIGSGGEAVGGYVVGEGRGRDIVGVGAGDNGVGGVGGGVERVGIGGGVSGVGIVGGNGGAGGGGGGKWRRMLGMRKRGDGKVSTFEKAWCVSVLAWILAIIGCLVAVGIITGQFAHSIRNKSIQVDLVPAERLTIPRLTWCNTEDNTPAFFNPLPSEFKGPPIMGASFFKDGKKGQEPMLFPDTRDLFREVVIAKGTAEEKRRCRERLTRFDVDMLNQRDERSPDVLKCRVCLQAKKKIDIENPNKNPQSSASSLVFVMGTSRLLESCRLTEYRNEALTAFQAFFNELDANFEDIVEQGYLDLDEADPSLLERDANGTIPFIQNPLVPGGSGPPVVLKSPNPALDNQVIKYFSFACNMMFLSGYFYPTNTTEKQRWRFENATNSFVPINNATVPFYISTGTPKLVKFKQDPEGLPTPPPQAPPGLAPPGPPSNDSSSSGESPSQEASPPGGGAGDDGSGSTSGADPAESPGTGAAPAPAPSGGSSSRDTPSQSPPNQAAPPSRSIILDGILSRFTAFHEVRQVPTIPPLPSEGAAAAGDGNPPATPASTTSGDSPDSGNTSSGDGPPGNGTSTGGGAPGGSNTTSGTGPSAGPPPKPATVPQPYQTPLPILISRDVLGPFPPVITIYSEIVKDGDNSTDSFEEDPSDALTRISADQTVFLRIQLEKDFDDVEKYRARRFNSITSTDFKVTSESNVAGYFQHTLDLAFENFLTESITLREVYSTSQFLADALNMFGIFLGLSVFALLIVPATTILIKSRTAKK